MSLEACGFAGAVRLWKKPAMLCCFLPVLAALLEGGAFGVVALLP